MKQSERCFVSEACGSKSRKGRIASVEVEMRWKFEGVVLKYRFSR